MSARATTRCAPGAMARSLSQVLWRGPTRLWVEGCVRYGDRCSPKSAHIRCIRCVATQEISRSMSGITPVILRRDSCLCSGRWTRSVSSLHSPLYADALIRRHSSRCARATPRHDPQSGRIRARAMRSRRRAIDRVSGGLSKIQKMLNFGFPRRIPPRYPVIDRARAVPQLSWHRVSST